MRAVFPTLRLPYITANSNLSELYNPFNKDDKKREEHVADCIKDNKRRIAFFRTKDALGIELYRFVGGGLCGA